MKRMASLLAAGLALVPFTPAALAAKDGSNAGKKRAASAARSNLSTARLRIQGMSCDGCASGIAGKLGRMKGVKSARVDHSSKLGTVRYDPGVCKPADFLAAVKKSGFGAALVK